MALLAVGSLAAAGCSSDDETPSSTTTAKTTTTIEAGATAATEAKRISARVVDVRTPEEFAAQHIDGAWLLDVQDPTFGDAIAQLDPATTYVVYCHSGNRSARAATAMRAAGLTVLDGGGIDDMIAAGWPTAAGEAPSTTTG